MDTRKTSNLFSYYKNSSRYSQKLFLGYGLNFFFSGEMNYVEIHLESYKLLEVSNLKPDIPLRLNHWYLL